MRRFIELSIVIFVLVLSTSAFAGVGTWTPLNNGLYGGSIQDMAISSDGRTVYATTYFNGVFKSTDGGITWSKAGLDFEWFVSVAVDPSDPNRVFAGDRRSTDGG